MNLVVGQKYHVKLTRILEKGVVVELEDGDTEFVHISNLSRQFVKNIEDVVTVGCEYDAEGIRGRARPVELRLLTDGTSSTNVKSPVSQPRATESQAIRPPKVQYPTQQQYVRQSRPTRKPQPTDTSLDAMLQRCQESFSDKMRGRDTSGYRRHDKRKRR